MTSKGSPASPAFLLSTQQRGWTYKQRASAKQHTIFGLSGPSEHESGRSIPIIIGYYGIRTEIMSKMKAVQRFAHTVAISSTTRFIRSSRQCDVTRNLADRCVENFLLASKHRGSNRSISQSTNHCKHI